MPGMTNCLVGSSQEKYSFGMTTLSTSSANYTFDETTVLAQIRAGLKNLATNYGAKFYGLTTTDNTTFKWTEYTSETLPIKITNVDNKLKIVFGTTVDSLITLGGYNGFTLFKCEFTKKFGYITALVLGKAESSTNEVFLAITGGDTVVLGQYQIETSPWIGLSYAD